MDDKTVRIQIMMDRHVVYSRTGSTLSLVRTFTTWFEGIYYTLQEIGAYFFRGINLEGTEVPSDVLRNQAPPYEIVCVTLQDYFNRKECDNLLGRVFATNANRGY